MLPSIVGLTGHCSFLFKCFYKGYFSYLEVYKNVKENYQRNSCIICSFIAFSEYYESFTSLEAMKKQIIRYLCKSLTCHNLCRECSRMSENVSQKIVVILKIAPAYIRSYMYIIISSSNSMT